MSTHPPSLLRPLLRSVLLLFLIAGTLSAEVVFLKNGSKVETREPYEVDGDEAVLVLTNGTVTRIPLADIDIERTDAANRPGFGSAQVLEGGETTPVPLPEPTTQRGETRTLSEVAAERDLQAQRRDQPAAAREDVNPAAVRLPLADAELRRYLGDLYSTQEFSPELFEGTGAGIAVVRLTTDSEAAVFRGLVTTVLALLESGDKLEQPLAVLELEMRSSDGGQAGDFRITHDRAEALRSREISPQEFYVRYVEF